MISADAYFEDLLMRVVEGIATEDEFTTFQEIIRRDQELRNRYAREMRLHALLGCRRTVRRQAAVGSRGTWKRAWWKVAAAAAAVVVATVWQATTARRSEELASFAQATAARGVSLLRSGYGGQGSGVEAIGPVVLMRGEGAVGLVLPGRLPGTVRLGKGQATVRLGSGVALTLLGPLELEVHDAMRVRLDRGRLLAEVPPVASGFTVRTRELEVWDIGTVFGVSAEAGCSDVFVFKGSVQVSEASGEPVDLCGAGEGVRAVEGHRPFKFAADWPEARKVLFAAGHGARAMFETAEQVAEMWVKRYAPEEAWLVRARIEEAVAAYVASQRAPFSKSAWVRSSAPARQEEGNMTTAQVVAALAASVTMMGAMPSGGTSAPIRVDTSPHHNRHWMTVFTNDVPLRWEWPAAAVSAELSIVGMGSTFATNFTEVTTAYSWRAFATPTPVTENVYTLALTFRDGGGGVVGTQSAKLAVLAGAFGRITVDPGPSDRRWEKVKDDVVIPYDAGWAEATADAETSRLVIAKGGGATQDNLLPDASGYFGWKLKNSGWGYGAFTLALTFPGTQGEWAAALTYVPGGTILSVR